MPTYTVSCANPPAELRIENGDEIRVQGTKLGDNITAKSLQNLTKKSPECKCETGFGILVVPEPVDVTGVARSIIVGTGYIQFELEVG